MSQRSILTRLPNELLIMIYHYVGRSDVLSLLLVSKHINASFLQSHWLRCQINKELGNYNPRDFPKADWTRVYVILNQTYVIDSNISILLKTGWKTSGIPGIIEEGGGYLTDGYVQLGFHDSTNICRVHVLSGISNRSLLIVNRATVEFLLVAPKELKNAEWPSRIRTAAYHSDLLLLVGLISTSGFKTSR